MGRQREGVDGGERYQTAGESALFTKSGISQLFLVQKSEGGLGGFMMDQESFKNTWEGVTRKAAAEEFPTAFQPWFEWAERCVWIGDNFIE
jgi:hypothetical protein